MAPFSSRLLATLLLTHTTSGCFASYESVAGDETYSTSTGTASTDLDSVASGTSHDASGTSSESSASDFATETTSDPSDDLGCSVPDGTPDPLCADSTPYCHAGTCVSCTALAPDHCAALDPYTPYCDPILGTCTGCSDHAQCSSGACRLRTGQCFSAEQQLWVGGNESSCSTGDGSQLAPFCTVVEALDVVNERPAGEAWIVRVVPRPEPYAGTLAPSGGHPLAIIGHLGNQRALLDGDGSATLDLFAPDLEVYLHNLDLQHTGDGIQTVRCAFGNELWMSDVHVLGGPALVLANCSVTMHSSTVQGGDIHVGPNGGSLVVSDSIIDQGTGDELFVRADVQLSRSLLRVASAGGGVRLDDPLATLTLDNSIVQGDTDPPALVVQAGRFDATFSTIVGGVGCVSPGPSTVRNSIVTGLSCGSVGVDHSLVDMGLTQGTGNVLLPMDALTELFVDPSGAMGDYHVLPDSMAKDVAIWRSGDALFDIDEDARIGDIDAPDYAGADIP